MTARSLESSSALMVVATSIALALCVTPAAAQGARAEQEARLAVFRELDIDGNGRISRSEFELKKVSVIYHGSKDRIPKVRLGDMRLSQRAFNELDLDKNGVLEIRDVVAAPPFQFAYWDRNEDGEIEWAELNAGVDALQR